MSVSTDLLAILACPSADHAPLRLETSGSGEELVCTSCLSRFPVTDGIPVLLADEAVAGPRGLGVPAIEQAATDAPATEETDQPATGAPATGQRATEDPAPEDPATGQPPGTAS